MPKYSLETKLKVQEKMVLALQTIMFSVFSELGKDPKLEAAIKAGFENAAASAEVLAMRMGGTEKGETGSDVLEMIEEFRKLTFGEKG